METTLFSLNFHLFKRLFLSAFLTEFANGTQISCRMKIRGNNALVLMQIRHCAQARFIFGQVLSGSYMRLPVMTMMLLLFFNPEHRILISADALWGNGFGIVFPEVLGGHGFSEVGATLKVIEELNPLIVLPGHGPIVHDVTETLARAYSKLNYFVQSPILHASHAAKVLLKFKLLELQSVDLFDFKEWFENTPLLVRIHQSFFKTTPIQE